MAYDDPHVTYPAIPNIRSGSEYDARNTKETVSFSTYNFLLVPGQISCIVPYNQNRKYLFIYSDINNANPVGVLFAEVNSMGVFTPIQGALQFAAAYFYEPWKIPDNAISVCNFNQSGTITGAVIEGL